MLKHSLNHYGTTTGLLPHPISSSHSGDTSVHHLHSNVLDPTRFLEGPGTHHVHSMSQSPPRATGRGYLDASYPSIHSPSRHYDTSTRTHSRGHLLNKNDQVQSHSNLIQSKPNGNIYFTPPPMNDPSHQQEQSSIINSVQHQQQSTIYRTGVLKSLALLSILSLLLALNSLIFLLKIVWPLNMSGGGSNNSEFKLMYETTLCLAAMSLSINLLVLLVTSAQYFLAISGTPSGTTKFLYKSSTIRGVAIGCFFLSIPLFLAAIVLYTFTHLSFAVPALIASTCVGSAIIFGGIAMIFHVYTWQKEKTNILVPESSPNHTIELSTLV